MDKYEIGYNMLLEYWDSIDEEEQKLLNKRLEEIGLWNLIVMKGGLK